MKQTLTPEETVVEKSKYTRKIQIPMYEPKNIKPDIRELYDEEYTNKLKANIQKADIPDDIKKFLNCAADRHTKFNFSRIADFYAHSDLEIKRLFEESALVIIDYNDAVRNAFISYQTEVDFDLEEYKENLGEDGLLKNLNDTASKIQYNKHIINELF